MLTEAMTLRRSSEASGRGPRFRARRASGLAALALLLAALLATLLVTQLTACATPQFQESGPGAEAPRLDSDTVIADDGYRLPLRHWPAKGERRAIVLGVHGFNDHSGSFTVLAEALTQEDITLYAHDQRGFGTTDQRGIWPGHARLAEDVTLVAELLRERYPETPLYLIGKSLGAAVAILGLTGEAPPPVAGSVLISPAVWGFDTMPWYQRLGLRLGVRLFPSMTFSARTTQRLGIVATDDPEIKARMAEDPLILRHARIDTLYGVTQAMDAALAAAEALPSPALVLYGGEDDIIPPAAICVLLDRLSDDDAIRFAFYPEGYHMLTRYTKREQTEADLAAWLTDTAATLPSGHELSRKEATRTLCD
ncbi:alpha/beta fold hydrolase [Halomonas sp. NO4]|uniref:alpha/beta fold hydrolase n=1 Tax=Halomonas sp. NO4 TaxID=2484813 RepID=UPI001F08ACD5|nr:alpha/beta fold hydrolase [Halomonas sp. NO4]